jgi:hypothetical protein
MVVTDLILVFFVAATGVGFVVPLVAEALGWPYPLKADIARFSRHVSNVPTAATDARLKMKEAAN